MMLPSTICRQPQRHVLQLSNPCGHAGGRHACRLHHSAHRLTSAVPSSWACQAPGHLHQESKQARGLRAPDHHKLPSCAPGCLKPVYKLRTYPVNTRQLHAQSIICCQHICTSSLKLYITAAPVASPCWLPRPEAVRASLTLPPISAGPPRPPAPPAPGAPAAGWLCAPSAAATIFSTSSSLGS